MSQPGESCAFCLAPLGGGGAPAAGTLVLPCGHAFHSTCALQFLLSESYVAAFILQVFQPL